MSQPPPSPRSWELSERVGPSLDAVDDLCAVVRNRLKCTAHRADCFGAELVLREALVNGLRHGSRQRPGAQVHCDVRLAEYDLTMTVRDEGPGFDWRKALDADLPTTETGGRGVALYAIYADRVTFNESGNQVELHKRLRPLEEETDDDSGRDRRTG
jgi:anti-sigma regulatory factor (Ser/Thr protein kinase)